MVYDIKLVPSLLAADFTCLKEQITEMEAAGITMLHYDVMDGHFVPNITMGAGILRAIREITTMTLDVHLMIEEPGRYIEDFAAAGADMISIHLEAGANVYRNLQLIRQHGCKVGLAINPHSPAMLVEDLLPMLDFINVMTVNPGFGGQKFIYETTSKIANLRAMATQAHHKDMDIEVDGGINAETAPYAIQAGANVLIAGTALFGHDDGLTAGIKAMEHVIEGGD